MTASTIGVMLVPLIRLLTLLLLTVLPAGAQMPEMQPSQPAAVPLGAMVREAKAILVLETAPDPENTGLIILKSTTALKGKKATFRILAQSLFNVNDVRDFITWGEKPRRQAVCFVQWKRAVLCVGNSWFWLDSIGGDLWTLISSLEDHRRTFVGSPATLVKHIRDLRAGREVVVNVEVTPADGDWHGPFRRDWFRGQKGPIFRVKTGPKDEAVEHGVLRLEKDGRFREPSYAGEGLAAEELPGLLRSLKNKDPLVRATAAFDVGLIRPEARTAIPALKKALNDADGFVRLHAVYSLARIEPKAEAELATIRKTLKDTDLEVRRSALGLLTRLGPRALPAFEELLKILDDSKDDLQPAAAHAIRLVAREADLSEKQRRAAIAALGRVLGKNEPLGLAESAAQALLSLGADMWTLVPALREALKSEREPMVLLAGDLLSRLDPPAVPVLVEALDREQRSLAAGNLATSLQTAGPRARLAVPALHRRLEQEKEPLSRLGLFTTLIEIDGKTTIRQAMPAICTLLTDREALFVCRSEALRLLEQHFPSLDGVEKRVRDALKDEVLSVRLTAARVLVNAGKTDVGLPVLLRELERRGEPPCLEALQDLETLGPKASAALPKLRKLAEKRDDPHHLQILLALWRVEDKPLSQRQKAIATLQQRKREVIPFLRFDLEDALTLGSWFRTSQIEEENLKLALEHFSSLLLDNPQAESRISEALKSKLPAVRVAAIEARMALNDTKDVVPSLLELLQEHPDYLWCLQSELIALGAKAKPLSPFLRRQFRSDGREMYLAARSPLESIDPAALHGVWRIADREQTPLSDKEMERCWEELTDDPGKAYVAECRLILGGEKAVTYLCHKLQPAAAVDAEKLARLLADLESKRFADRERATGELSKFGPLAEGVLRKALDEKPTLELRRRIEPLLEKLDTMRSPERLREWRGVEVLEQVRTPAARQHLRKLAGGAPGAFLTRQATTALAGMK